MKKFIYSLVVAIIPAGFLHAQTKVFKEVSDEISSQISAIVQDNTLVGYLAFTRLEKASEDSFNYRISIMDENLNDIGTVNFRDKGLRLQDVSFESDVLCIAYLRSTVSGNTYNKKEYKDISATAKNDVVIQFVGLDGKIIKTNSYKVDADITTDYIYTGKKVTAYSFLDHPVQLGNVAQKGFACFYGDNNNKNLMLFDINGNQSWQKKVSQDAETYFMKTTATDIYLLTKQKMELPVEGGYSLLGYSVTDGTPYDKIRLQNKKGDDLKVLSFDNDPVTGKLYLSGNIINNEEGNSIYTGKQISRGPYAGVFTMNITGTRKSDITEVDSYWSDGSQEETVSKRGKFTDDNSYIVFGQSFKDYNGNTYFAGSALQRKTRWGTIASSVITSPLLVPPVIILAGIGTTKCKLTDVVLLKQNSKGSIYFDNTIPAENTGYHMGAIPLSQYNNRVLHRLANSETKTNYLIVDDTKNIEIYDASKRKVIRTIPHKDGQIKTEVFPAKEGYILVSEYNKKEKYTRFSIEAL